MTKKRNLIGRMVDAFKRFGERNVPKDQRSEVPQPKPLSSKPQTEKVIAKTETALSQGQRDSRSRSRLKASSQYVWLSYRWVKFAGQVLRRKARTTLNPDGTINAVAVGKTFSAGRNAQRRSARVSGGKLLADMLSERRQRQLSGAV